MLAANVCQGTVYERLADFKGDNAVDTIYVGIYEPQSWTFIFVYSYIVVIVVISMARILVCLSRLTRSKKGGGAG